MDDTTFEIGYVYKVVYTDGSSENLDSQGDVKYAIIRHEMDNLTENEIRDALNEEYSDYHTNENSFEAYDIIKALGDVNEEMESLLNDGFDNVTDWPEIGETNGSFDGAYPCDILLIPNDEWLMYLEGERPENNTDPAALAIDEDGNMYVIHMFEDRLLATRLD